jgi:hypothetical protein
VNKVLHDSPTSRRSLHAVFTGEDLHCWGVSKDFGERFLSERTHRGIGIEFHEGQPVGGEEAVQSGVGTVPVRRRRHRGQSRFHVCQGQNLAYVLAEFAVVQSISGQSLKRLSQQCAG